MSTLTLLPDEFLVARFAAHAPIPEWALSAPFFSVTRTVDELSVVCVSAQAPADLPAERGWRCLQVVGPLDFGLVGILAALLAPLQHAGVSVFVLSTYDTDYVLIKQRQLSAAVTALQGAGHHVLDGTLFPGEKRR